MSSSTSSSISISSSSTSLIYSLSSRSSSSISFSSKSSYSSYSSESSSSSSFHYSYSRLLPFSIEEEIINPVLCLAYDGTYMYAGTNGKVLRSINGMTWDTYLNTGDVYVKSLYVANNKLYIGTSPAGNIYVSELSTDTISLSQIIGGEISAFISYNGHMYAFTSNPSGVYKYNVNLATWELIYSLYTNMIYKVMINNGEIILFINSNNIIRFDGIKFYSQSIKYINEESISSSSSSG